MRKTLLLLLSAFIFTICGSIKTFGWTEHPMLVGPSLAGLPVWNNRKAIEVRSLESFLVKNERALEEFLKSQEEWSVKNLPNYSPRPEALTFKATGTGEDIKHRFLTAIRINPHAKLPLYLHLLSHQADFGLEKALPQDITTLKDLGIMSNTNYIWLNEGSTIPAFDVMNTATDEPDYGFDLGLFDDNDTDYGATYGFGNQPFGNPKLEYSSQAPFHMGFYHEADIVYFFGPILKRTYVDYRINLYKSLSLFAFKQGEDYWGWRFMGWAMHYVGDLSMPYHSKPLPAVSPWKMIWINIKAMLGWKQSRTDAIQLVSNKHTVFEEFQWQELRKAHVNQDMNHPFMIALTNPYPAIAYTDRFIYDVLSKESAAKSIDCNKALLEFIPFRLVQDPAIEANETSEIKKIVEVVRQEKGNEAVTGLNLVIAERMRAFGMAMRSFLDEMLLNMPAEAEAVTEDKSST
ncbi:MAG: hypothetical protein FD155_2738 [Bacteroidetes bacterium]|nr:MAG: hypothetical protein FD155_2738 [Bacteroidota bacterium]